MHRGYTVQPVQYKKRDRYHERVSSSRERILDSFENALIRDGERAATMEAVAAAADLDVIGMGAQGQDAQRPGRCRQAEHQRVVACSS